jgi:hypothetical protein
MRITILIVTFCIPLCASPFFSLKNLPHTPYDIGDTIRLGTPYDIDATVRLGAPYDIGDIVSKIYFFSTKNC